MSAFALAIFWYSVMKARVTGSLESRSSEVVMIVPSAALPPISMNFWVS